MKILETLVDLGFPLDLGKKLRYNETKYV